MEKPPASLKPTGRLGEESNVVLTDLRGRLEDGTQAGRGGRWGRRTRRAPRWSRSLPSLPIRAIAQRPTLLQVAITVSIIDS